MATNYQYEKPLLHIEMTYHVINENVKLARDLALGLFSRGKGNAMKYLGALKAM